MEASTHRHLRIYHQAAGVQPTDEELNQWKEYAASLSDKWRELIGEELYNQVSELFNY